jgi:hypothetical protein
MFESFLAGVRVRRNQRALLEITPFEAFEILLV